MHPPRPRSPHLTYCVTILRVGQPPTPPSSQVPPFRAPALLLEPAQPSPTMSRSPPAPPTPPPLRPGSTRPPPALPTSPLQARHKSATPCLGSPHLPSGSTPTGLYCLTEIIHSFTCPLLAWTRLQHHSDILCWHKAAHPSALTTAHTTNRGYSSLRGMLHSRPGPSSHWEGRCDAGNWTRPAES